MNGFSFFLSIIGIAAYGSGASAQPRQYSFAQIWGQATQGSADVQAAEHESQAAEIAAARSARHWYPRLFLDGRVYSTNDAAMNFMSILNQRQISASDFSPNTLNQPGSNVYERGSLALDLPLFEGGAKVAAVDSMIDASAAKQLELKAARLRLYAELAANYASILALQNQSSDLTQLLARVDQILSQYRVGAKSNPVGYSGLLGLKTLRNRLEGLLVVNAAEMDGLRAKTNGLVPGLPEDWIPKQEEVDGFIKRSLAVQTAAGQSLTVRMMEAMAQAIEKNKAIERAKFLPRIGLFATGDLYAGNRGTATGYTGGVYLQWDLISATSFGAVSEAEHRAQAARTRAESAEQKIASVHVATQKTIESLGKNLKLMRESTKLLEEQSATTSALFRNGSINALQLAEVLSRRADLMVSLAEVERGWAQAHANLLLNSGTEEVRNEN